jgi:hypothetical protein
MTAEFQRSPTQLASAIQTSCRLRRVRFDVYGRIVSISSDDQAVGDGFLGAGRSNYGIQAGPLGRGFFRELPNELAVVPLRTPFRVLSRQRLPRLGLACLPHREVFPPASCVMKWHFSATLAEQAKGMAT